MIKISREHLPCVMRKCITYPTCIHRKLIPCRELNVVLAYLQDYMSAIDAWDELKTFFPNVRSLHMDVVSRVEKLYYKGVIMEIGNVKWE